MNGVRSEGPGTLKTGFARRRVINGGDMSYPQARSAEADECFERDVAPFIRCHLEEAFRLFDTSSDVPSRVTPLVERWGRDAGDVESRRFDTLKRVTASDLSGLAILDMAAGCGSFVFEGLAQGHDVWGVEPEAWKVELMQLKSGCFGFPEEWTRRVREGAGEHLPSVDGEFDLVDSWQTFEHVQDESACLREIYRVLKPAGVAVVHFPSYASFYEGHYMMPWLPYLGGSAARFWVSLLGRPTEGLSSFHTITGSAFARKARSVGFTVLDLEVMQFRQLLRKRLKIASRPTILATAAGVYRLKRMASQLARAFRAERSAHLLLLKPPANQGLAAAFLAEC